MSEIARVIRIVTISGSARENNNTEKALALVQDELKQIEGVEVFEIQLSKLRLAIPGTEVDDTDRTHLRDMIGKADGIILATPEYHGSFSSLLKLAIENMGFPSALKGKPVGLLGIAAGSIGAVKSLEHLRSVCSHVGALVLPGAVSVSKARTVFDHKGNCLDQDIELNIRKIGPRMVQYIIDTTCPDRSFEEMIRNEKQVVD